MDIILHVGVHRTGTTTFQSYLRRNREALFDLRLAVWEPEQLRGGLANGMFGQGGPLTPDKMRKAGRAAGLIRLEIRRLERLGVDRLLVSEENMIGSVRDNLHRLSLYSQASPRLARFAEVFGPHCSRIAISIRSYENYWSSALAYAVPGGLRWPDAELLDRLVAQPRRWRHVIEEVTTLLPAAECVVLPFEVLAGQPQAQLSAALGEPVPPLADARQWLHRSPNRDMLRQVLKDRGQRALARALGEKPERWQPFGPDQVVVLQAHYAEDLDWLRAGADGRAVVLADACADNRAGAGADPQGATREKGRDHDQATYYREAGSI